MTLNFQPHLRRLFAAACLAGLGLPQASAAPAERTLQAKAIVTDDADWLEKWQSSSEPTFHVVDEMPWAKRSTFVVFLAMPAVDAQGRAKVVCDIKAWRADGAVSIDAKNQPCLDGEGPFASRAIHLSKVAIGVGGDSSDKGVWTFELVAHDMVSGARVKTQAKLKIK